MSNEYTARAESLTELYAAMNQIAGHANRGIVTGAVEIVVRRPEQKRSGQANRLMWKLLHDIAGQIEWAGTKLSAEDWKDLITASMRKQQVVPGLDGGLVALGSRTSKMRKAEFSDLIESIYAVGSERGVKWSADTSVDWDAYKEARAA